jgi:glycosyltransferase involved in cell wall biosynthesis
VGDGKCRAELEKQATELGIGDVVRFTGFVENPYPYLAQADLFVHTSRWEGLGIVLVEALALGTPVVATDCPSGPSEVLDHGRLGHLVPVGDAEAIADCMEAILDQPPRDATNPDSVASYQTGASALAYLQALQLTPHGGARGDC